MSVHQQIPHRHYIVDDILIKGRSDAEINDLIEELKRDEITLHHERTAEGYLGVDIRRDKTQITCCKRV